MRDHLAVFLLQEGKCCLILHYVRLCDIITVSKALEGDML